MAGNVIWKPSATGNDPWSARNFYV